MLLSWEMLHAVIGVLFVFYVGVVSLREELLFI